MKYIIINILVLCLFHSCLAQSYEQWEAATKNNKGLVPRYGNLPKTEKQIEADSLYVKQMMSLPQFKSRREASDHVIGLGFQYYYRSDLKTAMYRFNQAYLLDTT